MTDDGPVVYTIQADWGGPVKIGFCAKASSVPARLASLQTSSPWTLVVRRVIPAPMRRSTESDMHEQLAMYRLAGEWFLNTPAVAMATGARLPGTRDIERAMLPVLEAAFQAGVREGRRQHEIETREHVRHLGALIAGYFDDEEIPPEETDALAAARDRLERLVGKRALSLVPPTRSPSPSAEIADSRENAA